jgi:WD40-like Beta Propeller Repeat
MALFVLAVASWSVLPAAVVSAASCPNELLRTGPSAQLADCRAYELVTPPDSNGRLFRGLPEQLPGGTALGDIFPTELASPTLDSFVFSTRANPLPGVTGANGLWNELEGYEALRTEAGWHLERRVTPAAVESVVPEVGGMSSDHGYIFVYGGPVTNEGASFYGTLHQGNYLGDREGNFELVGCGSLGCEPQAEGRYISSGGTHVLFSTGKLSSGSQWCALAISKSRPCPSKQLDSRAPPTGTGAIYDRAADGPTEVVSLLPGDVTPAAGEDAAYQGASVDGLVVAFEIKGTLYVRVRGSGASTTKKVTEAESVFGGLSSDGRYLFYVSGGDIHRFDTETEIDEEINASGDGQMVNVSADGSHVYFISEQQLDGASGSSGQPNLYVWTGGAPHYIATVSPSDLLDIATWTEVAESGPGVDQTRTTPDGSAIIFRSGAQLTPYDNAGHREIYRYAAGEGLECVSCNSESGPATADARLQDPNVANTAAVIHNLSGDGRRVFFETSESLVSADIDGVNDIYEWQLPAEGEPARVDLISSGSSTAYAEVDGLQDPNVILAITPNGNEVFFRSQDALTPEAGTGGVQAIYDARVGGGFAFPPPSSPCVEAACRPSPLSPPTFGEAATQSLKGTGNVVPSKKKHKRHRCRHGFRHHGKRCIRKHRQRSATRAVASVSGVQLSKARADYPKANYPMLASETKTEPAGTAAFSTLSGPEFEDYGIESVAAALSTTTAAAHPDLTTSLVLSPKNSVWSPQTEDVVVALPPGLVGNPNVADRCSTGEFVSNECPVDSQVGVSRLKVKNISELQVAPIFNLEPPHPGKEVARLGLAAPLFPVFIDLSVRTAGDYGVTATIDGSPAAYPLESAETTIWGNPADPSHDALRDPPGPDGPPSASGLDPIAFLTNPSVCQQGGVGFSVTSYEFPGQVFSAFAPLEPITNCAGVPFAPTFEAHPTSRKAGAPTGLKTKLRLPQSSDPEVRGTATMREARVTLPEGMTIASGAAEGLAACSDEQVGFHREVDAACPDSAKLGTATISSPALPEALEGAIYQRSPEPGHLFRLWLVSDDFGLHIKLPGEIEPDPKTGQLTAVFSDLPQVPVEEIDLDVWGGPQAPLKNPDSCGTYATTFTFAPHSDDPAVSGQTQMTIDEGCSPRGFSPQLHGGAVDPVAGAFSPFVFDLTREDGEQNLANFEVTLPKGELAKLKGVPLCPDAAAVSGDCPAAAKIGFIVAAVGPGPNPLWIPQPGKDQPTVFLAGPYQGAPYSIVSTVPAQAGPFDLGDVVVRSAVAIDPESAQVTVKTDPLPQIVAGVPVIYRRLHAVVDRPEFTLNPTDCSDLSLSSTVLSTEGAIAHPSQRFQVNGCRALKFKPKVVLKLKGGPQRADYPALTAILKARKGDANLRRVSVALPHSEFLAQEHIRTICTRVQFAARKCPKGSVYGKAKAWTPLLDKPLEGSVYLRSSDHLLPDLVMDLRGPIEVAVAGRIDAVKGGIRTTFPAVPDAPITKFLLQMKGGAKGLLTNSQNICTGKHRALVKIGAQNGRAAQLKPVLAASCGK